MISNFYNFYDILSKFWSILNYKFFFLKFLKYIYNVNTLKLLFNNYYTIHKKYIIKYKTLFKY